MVVLSMAPGSPAGRWGQVYPSRDGARDGLRKHRDLKSAHVRVSGAQDGDPAGQSSDCTPASSCRAITIRWTWLVPS